MSERKIGEVKFFDSSRGYGFIKMVDGGKDMFVHVSQVEKAGLMTLESGVKIYFDVETDKKTNKPVAKNLSYSK